MKNISKKVLSAFLSIVMIFYCFASVNAYTLPKLKAEIKENDDETYTVSVYLTQVRDVTEIAFSIPLDSSVLAVESLSVENTDIEDAVNNFQSISKKYNAENTYFIHSYTTENNNIRFLGYFIEPFSSEKDNFHLCDIIIKNTDEKKSPSLIVSDTISTIYGSFSSSNEYSVKKNKIINSNYCPEPQPAADVNADGEISAADARLILRHSVKLQELPVSAIPYANMNDDNAITAADAREALRTSVDLEDKFLCDYSITLCDSTCSKGGTYHFYCNLTGKSFSMKIDYGEHDYSELACTQDKQCKICGEIEESAKGHKFNSSNKCESCGIKITEIEKIKDKLIPVIEEITHCDTLALQCGNSNDFSGYFANIEKSVVLLYDAVAICGNSFAFIQIKTDLEKVCRMRYNTLFNFTDEDGYIPADVTTYKAVLSEVNISSHYFDNVLNTINRFF